MIRAIYERQRVDHLALYTRLAEYYYAIEKVHRDVEKEISFLVEHFQVGRYNKIVDIGCGTGEHMELLRRQGYDIIGIDINASMLRVARKRFPQLKLIRNDMTRLDIVGPFDGFFSLFGTIDYLLEDRKIKKFLRSVHARLRAGGKLILDVWNAEPVRRIRGRDMINVSSIVHDGVAVHRNRGFTLIESGARTIVQVDYLYYIDDEELTDRHFMRAFFQKEIEDILHSTGFSDIRSFGKFDKSRYMPSSNRIILVAMKNA